MLPSDAIDQARFPSMAAVRMASFCFCCGDVRYLRDTLAIRAGGAADQFHRVEAAGAGDRECHREPSARVHLESRRDAGARKVKNAAVNEHERVAVSRPIEPALDWLPQIMANYDPMRPAQYLQYIARPQAPLDPPPSGRKRVVGRLR